MRISLATIQQLIGHDLTPVDALVERINQQLGGVEDVIDLASKYKDAKIVRVVECEKHPNADRLNVCKVDAGTGELIQVVCGAPNVRADIWAVWLPPASVVPSTFGDDEPFVLGARELRGVMSNGMLAAGDELAINGDHDGIVVLTDADLSSGRTLVAGGSFAETFDLNDTVIDIENKMFTHRPDLFGQLGVAREIFAILQPEPSHDVHADIRFPEPEWYWPAASPQPAQGLELAAYNDIPDKVPRIMFAVMDNVSIAPSPFWLQTTLVRWGAKPINNVVDLTNYIMLLTAQPTHAYDYDKIRGKRIGARAARVGESVHLLNGKTYELTPDDIVIADGEGAIGLAGIMGGGNSEVSADTTRIVLEVGTFDMYAVRKTSMRHGLFTDALTRFNKGQSPLQNDRVMAKLSSMLESIGGVRASETFDLAEGLAGADVTTLSGTLRVSAGFINERLGLDLTPAHIGNLLRFANFASYKPEDGADDELEITAPFWRTDIELPEDIVEEIGRLYGFDKLPRELPRRSAKAAPQNDYLRVLQSVRHRLSRAGANEVLTYSFVHERLLRSVGQDPSHAFKLSNALSPDLQYYRLSITPSLLDKVYMNLRAGHGSFAMFEIGRVHFNGEMSAIEPTVPNEDTHVAGVVACADKYAPAGASYFMARRYMEQIFDTSVHSLIPMNEFDLTQDESGRQLTAPYQPDRSAVIVKDNQIWGVVGEFRADVRRAFKLPTYSAGFEIHADVINISAPSYRPLSKYPSVTQDVSIRTKSVAFDAVARAVSAAIRANNDDIRIDMTPITIYRPGTSDETTTTFRLVATSDERTLTDADMRPVIDEIARIAERDIDGHIV